MPEQGIRRRHGGLKSIVASVALLCAVVLPVSPANAQTAIASCPGAPDAGGGATVGPPEVGQTFSVSSPARAEAVRMVLRLSSGTGQFLVELRAADGTGPTGPVLAAGAINSAHPPRQRS